MPERSSDLIDGAPVHLRRFLTHYLVECARCQSRATVVGPNAERSTPRIACGACSYLSERWAPPSDSTIQHAKQARCPRCNEWLGEAKTLYRASNHELDVMCGCGAIRTTHLPARWIVGAPVDPYFRLPLWLQTAVGGENLWAYNADHLAFLHSYLSGTLRQREPGHNRSLASRLPAWMKSAKRRDDVLKGLRRLQRRLEVLTTG